MNWDEEGAGSAMYGAACSPCHLVSRRRTQSVKMAISGCWKIQVISCVKYKFIVIYFPNLKIFTNLTLSLRVKQDDLCTCRGKWWTKPVCGQSLTKPLFVSDIWGATARVLSKPHPPRPLQQCLPAPTQGQRRAALMETVLFKHNGTQIS